MMPIRLDWHVWQTHLPHSTDPRPFLLAQAICQIAPRPFLLAQAICQMRLMFMNNAV